MNDNFFESNQAQPIDPASFCNQFAAEAATTALPGPFQAVLAAIRQLSTVDFTALAQAKLGIFPTGSEGNAKKLTDSDRAILVVEYVPEILAEANQGIAMINGGVHVYDGTHWAAITEKEAEVLLGTAAERLGIAPAKSRNYKFREELLKQFIASHSGGPAVKRDGEALINFLNGTLVVSDEREIFRGHDHGDHLTYVLPYRYDPTATCPLFDLYLQRVLPDESSRQVVEEFLGWTFLRSLKLEKILLLLGDGHNGKSVLFDVINAVLGEENISSVSLKELSKVEHRAPLAGKLLNFGSEISDRCNADLLKRLASGEPIEARRLYKDLFIMRNYARLAFNANNLPREVEQSTGFFRRFLIIPFTQTISDEEKDPDLARKIIGSELPGILNRILRGMHRLRSARKFSKCSASDEALETYRRESDSVAYFLSEEGWGASTTLKKPKGVFYDIYRTFCLDHGLRSVSAINFGKRLKRFGITESKSGSARFWHVAQIQVG